MAIKSKTVRKQNPQAQALHSNIYHGKVMPVSKRDPRDLVALGDVCLACFDKLDDCSCGDEAYERDEF